MNKFSYAPKLHEITDELPETVELLYWNEDTLRNRVLDIPMDGSYSHKDGEYVGIFCIGHGVSSQKSVVKPPALSGS